ncbi:MAG: hypothetical protein UHU19_03220 [Lachnospiraceae bacterium]|nr:hypothetical protein [Lachnospiraceae bacterium]
MKTKFIKTLAMALTVATAITATAVPTHAEETGTVVPHYTVGQDGIAKNGEKYVDANGNMIKNAFVADGAYTYFVQNDGTTMKNRLTYHPNGVSVIYFDENGHEVFDNFVNVKHSITGEPVDDLCYFNTFGEMYVDVVTYDKTGTNLYYANPYGVIERNGWFTYSDLQGGGQGYANPDGTLLKDTYTTYTDGSTVYMEGDGSVRGSRTCAKHEHNWLPHYATQIVQDAYDETTETTDVTLRALYVFKEAYRNEIETWYNNIPPYPRNGTDDEKYNSTLIEIAQWTKWESEGKAIDCTKRAENVTPEEKAFYENYYRQKGYGTDYSLDVMIRGYYTHETEYTGIGTMEGRHFKLSTPITETTHHDAVTEQVIDYYYCNECGHATIMPN